MDNQAFRQYLRIILRWWWLLTISAIIPVGVSYHFASKQPDLYQAKATLLVGGNVFQDPDPNRSEIDLSNTLAAAYAELVTQRSVTQAVIERLDLERTSDDLVDQIRTDIRSGAQLLEIYVTDITPEASALIANALADELIRRSPTARQNPEQQEFIWNQMEELQVKIEDVSTRVDELTNGLYELTSAAEIQDAEERIEALERVKTLYQSAYADLVDSYHAEPPNELSLFEPAVAPNSPISRNIPLIIAVAGAAGIGLALGAIFLMEYLDTSLRWEEDAPQSLLEMPVFGAIPRVSGKKGSLSASNLLSPIAQGIRSIQANIFLSHPDRSFKSLLVTSPDVGEGKSFILANLAVGLASGGEQVVVVDADMRKPNLHEIFDCPNIVGLVDAINAQGAGGKEPDPIPLQETEFDNLKLLSAGRPPADPVMLLTSPRLPSLLKSLLNEGDIVLIDSPPVLGPPDATVIATQVEATILVVSAGQTPRNLARRARDCLLGQQGVNLLGVVVNRAKTDGSYYHYESRSETSKRWKRWWREWWLRRSTEDGLLTLGEAATRLGISRGQARRWCKSGRLPATRKWLLWWRVDPEGLERMIEDTLEISTDEVSRRVEAGYQTT
jgi:non-specific protein-tyrosine kinase